MQSLVFSEAQASHALQVVLNLMHNRRFFLFREDPRSLFEKDLGHVLDPKIFSEALNLDQEIRDIYKNTKSQAEEMILSAEQRLGLIKPDLSGNKNLVECSRYTGGLDICRVYPLTAFATLVPATPEELRRDLYRNELGEYSEDDFSPRKLAVIHEYVEKIASFISEQFEKMEISDPNNTRCLLLLHTRFFPSENKNGDFMEEKVLDMQAFPHALGYLFYKYSLATRIVRHNHVVFSSSRHAHVNVRHWSDKKPEVYFESDGGYDCKVYFATVL